MLVLSEPEIHNFAKIIFTLTQILIKKIFSVKGSNKLTEIVRRGDDMPIANNPQAAFITYFSSESP